MLLCFDSTAPVREFVPRIRTRASHSDSFGRADFERDAAAVRYASREGRRYFSDGAVLRARVSEQDHIGRRAGKTDKVL